MWVVVLSGFARRPSQLVDKNVGPTLSLAGRRITLRSTPLQEGSVRESQLPVSRTKPESGRPFARYCNVGGHLRPRFGPDGPPRKRPSRAFQCPQQGSLRCWVQPESLLRFLTESR